MQDDHKLSNSCKKYTNVWYLTPFHRRVTSCMTWFVRYFWHSKHFRYILQWCHYCNVTTGHLVNLWRHTFYAYPWLCVSGLALLISTYFRFNDRGAKKWFLTSIFKPGPNYVLSIKMIFNHVPRRLGFWKCNYLLAKLRHLLEVESKIDSKNWIL